MKIKSGYSGQKTYLLPGLHSIFPAKARDTSLGSMSHRIISAGQQPRPQTTAECVWGSADCLRVGLRAGVAGAVGVRPRGLVEGC